MPNFKTLAYENDNGIATVSFRREKDTNPFSRLMTLELTSLCRDIKNDKDIRALILFGGPGRCFSVGGDFNDVSSLQTRSEISEYLSEIIDLYISILQVNVPVIAAIDRYAIGQGLQVALMSDWRIASTGTLIQMPELKNGTACPLGSAILESLLGRALMLELILDCSFIDSAAARSMRLLNQLCESQEVYSTAKAQAVRLASFPQIPFSSTKRIQNQRLVDILEFGRQSSIDSHVATVSTKSGQKHYDNILGRGPA